MKRYGLLIAIVAMAMTALYHRTPVPPATNHATPPLNQAAETARVVGGLQIQVEQD